MRWDIINGLIGVIVFWGLIFAIFKFPQVAIDILVYGLIAIFVVGVSSYVFGHASGWLR